MVRVTRRRHGQTAELRILEGITVVAPQSGGGVENFESVDRQFLEGRKTDAGPKQVVRMRRNGEPAAFVDEIANLACRPPLQIGERRADREKMTLRGRHFDSGNDEE